VGHEVHEARQGKSTNWLGDARMRPRVVRGCKKGLVMALQIQSKVGVEVRETSEGIRIAKVESEVSCIIGRITYRTRRREKS